MYFKCKALADALYELEVTHLNQTSPSYYSKSSTTHSQRDVRGTSSTKSEPAHDSSAVMDTTEMFWKHTANS